MNNGILPICFTISDVTFLSRPGTEAAMNWILEHMGDPGKYFTALITSQPHPVSVLLITVCVFWSHLESRRSLYDLLNLLR